MALNDPKSSFFYRSLVLDRGHLVLRSVQFSPLGSRLQQLWRTTYRFQSEQALTPAKHGFHRGTTHPIGSEQQDSYHLELRQTNGVVATLLSAGARRI